MRSQLNSLIDVLSLDHRRGAAEIVEDAEVLFIEIARLGVKSPASAEPTFERAVRRLAGGQPSMAPVLNLLNRVCAVRELTDDDWPAFEAGIQSLTVTFRALLDRMEARVGEIPQARETLLTFSNSSTVTRMITACRRVGWPQRVIVGEGRPILEGIAMARKLTSAGIPVRLFTDAALMSRITEADAVWVGGDSLSRNGLVNKVGSRALAMLAKQRNIPFISLMASDKLLSPQMLPYFHLLKQNPREIAADDAEGLDVVNEYYETLPLDIVTHIFTEGGLSKPQKLVSQLETEPVCELFKSLAVGSR
ncbi:MAG: hypothetical protein V2A61_00685 [Calditrichota bacterium]